MLRLHGFPLNLPVVLLLVKVIPPVGAEPVTAAEQVADEPTVTGLEHVTVMVVAASWLAVRLPLLLLPLWSASPL